MTANNLLALLSGTMTSMAQTFQVQDQSSGFVGGIPNNRNWSLDYTVNQGVPTIPTPTFRTTRTLPDQIAASVTGVVRGKDEDVRQPHVHQVSTGITREILWNMAIEARYVGTFGRDLFRGVDLDQLDAVNALGGAFMQDFVRARQNGFLSLAANQGFDPAFKPDLPGSQPLTVLNTFGQLGNNNVRTAIQQGELARLADLYYDHWQSDGGRQSRLPDQPRHLRGRVRAERIVPGL
jgi:hypothetical protein